MQVDEVKISMHAEQPDHVENEFRNIKLKLKGPNRHSELQAVKALMAMSAQNSLFRFNNHEFNANIGAANYSHRSSHQDQVVNLSGYAEGKDSHHNESIELIKSKDSRQIDNGTSKRNKTSNDSYRISSKGGPNKEKPIDLSRSESPEPIYGLAITMTEEEFKELAEREGIEDVIGEPICKLCGGLFSGPLGIALHMCPAMKRQTYRCDICGEDKWKTKANLHSHIKWCRKRLSTKTEQHESKQVY